MPKKKRAKRTRASETLEESDLPSVSRNNPPESGRYKPGQSGNYKGRPKGSKNLRTILEEAARATVTATIDGKSRKITKIQATAWQLATKAAGGDKTAMIKFLDWIDEIEARAAASRPTQFSLGEVDLAVLRAAYERMMQCDPKLRDE